MASTLGFDRRWIFLAMGAVVLSLYAFGSPEPLSRAEPVQNYYDTIDALPPGSIVLFSADFDPASAAELRPMYDATIHHMFRRNLRVISVATWPAAPPFSRRAFREIAPRYGKVYGKDWVELGFLVGDDVAMGIIGQSLRSAYPRDDVSLAPYDDFPILKEVGDSSRGIALLVTISAGFPGILEWVPQLCSRYGVPCLCGTTAVQTPSVYPYYPNPLKGFLGAATGATQYLQLVSLETPELDAMRIEQQRRMLVQSWSHGLIIALILIGNVIYFSTRRKRA